MEKHIVIIGGGITGCAIARTLSKYEHLTIHLIEKEADVGWGATKANTGIIHPGHEDDPTQFPLRARFCVEGNRQWKIWSDELDIPTIWPGEIMIARTDDEKSMLKKYFYIGKETGVKNLQIIDKDQLFNLEPNCTRDATAGLWAPTAGLMEPWEATIGLIENAVANGVAVHLDTEVTDIEYQDNQIKGVHTTKGFLQADIVINAAGLFADTISSMAGINEGSIRPRKGQYFLFDEDAGPKIQRIIHQVPTATTKGVYAVTTVEGNLMLGPTAENLSFDEKNDRSTTQLGLEYVWDHAAKLVHDLPPKTSISKIFAGLRPEPPHGDYVMRTYDSLWGFINVFGIRSPGLTAAPAIAEYVLNTLLQKELDLVLIEKKKWNPKRKKIQRFSKLPVKQQQELIKKNEAYGNIVCMCKEITEAEIIEAINRIKKLGGPVTLDSIKFRTLAMFGFCQGSFCRSRIADILAKELDIPLYKVTQNGKDTEYGIGDIKILQRKQGEHH